MRSCNEIPICGTSILASCNQFTCLALGIVLFDPNYSQFLDGITCHPHRARFWLQEIWVSVIFLAVHTRKISRDALLQATLPRLLWDGLSSRVCKYKGMMWKNQLELKENARWWMLGAISSWLKANNTTSYLRKNIPSQNTFSLILTVEMSWLESKDILRCWFK